MQKSKNIKIHIKKRNDWIKMWSAKCCINSCLQMGEEWTKKIKIMGKPIYLSPIILFHSKGVADCWATLADKNNLGKRLVSQTKINSKAVKEMINSLKYYTDKIISFTKQNISNPPTLDIYNKFWEIMSSYYMYHMSVKYVADYLPPKEIKKYLSLLEKARLYSESILKRQENFMAKLAEKISANTGFKKDLILSTTPEEIKNFINKTKLPDKRILAKRYSRSAQITKLGNSKIYTGKRVDIIEKIILSKTNSKIIHGTTAYKGKVTGLAKVILDPTNYNGIFQKGNILVTGMTRPEFLPFLKNASAILTDSGGLLSHAAIISRELGIPCVVGTKIATQVFKDGDWVEVDADQGIVRKIK